MSKSEHPKSLLIAGESGTGKSFSLKDIRGEEGVAYLNCEGGKPLPFKNKFKRITIDDPFTIFEILDQINEDTTNKFHTVIIDTVSFMMERFELVHVNQATNTMKAWGEYGKFFKTLMYDYVAKAKVFVIFLGHIHGELNEESGQMLYKVPVKGALNKNGLEAYFTSVINCKKVKLKELEKYDNDGNKLLNITDRDRELGYKHVFQTRTIKQTIGDRIRSPYGLFSDNETFIDNNTQIVMDRLTKYYSE